MTAATIPKNQAMPMAMIQRGLRRSLGTVVMDSSLAAAEGSVTATVTDVATGGSSGFTFEGVISLSHVAVTMAAG
jgi:hypothetical protein